MEKIYKVLIAVLINTSVGTSHSLPNKTVSILHLSIDDTRQGEPNNPGLFTRATATTAFVIEFWTDNRSNRRRNERVSFARFNMNNGTVTVQEDGQYMIYVSVTFYRRYISPSQYLVVVDEKTIMKCVRTEDIEALVENSLRPMAKCQIQGVFPLYKGQVISIKSGNNRQRIFANRDFSYWGIVKL